MFTYFLKNNVNSLIKIGKSNNVARRLSEIKGQCSFIQLSVFHVIEGNFEADFHDYYKDFRKEGEWFDIPDLSIEMINSDLFKIQSLQKEVIESIPFASRTYPEDVGIKNIEKQPDYILFLEKTGYTAPYYAFIMTLKHYIGGHAPGVLKRINEDGGQIENITVDNGEKILAINAHNYMEIPKKSDIGDFIIVITIKYTDRSLKISVGEEEISE